MASGSIIVSELLQPRLICSISFLHDATVEVRAGAGDVVGVVLRAARFGVRRGFFAGVADCERAGVFGAEEAVDAMSVMSESMSPPSKSSSLTCTEAARALISAS